jgi:hypothetical protein
MVKPNYHPNGTESFGRELALNENGQTLIVGEGAESSDSNGIGGNWQNAGAVGSGAIWMY